MMAEDELASAVIALREMEPAPKRTYLIREATRIVTSGMQGKPGKLAAHNFYQNLAVSNHNILLFLKSQGMDSRQRFDEALRYYKKARRAGTALHRAECDLLTAALYAADGDRRRAEKIFSKIDPITLRSDFESTAHLASYHAATGDATAAAEALKAAFRINPARTEAWLEVGDDFFMITGDPELSAAIGWMEHENKNMERKLSLPNGPSPKLDMTGGNSVVIRRKPSSRRR